MVVKFSANEVKMEGTKETPRIPWRGLSEQQTASALALALATSSIVRGCVVLLPTSSTPIPPLRIPSRGPDQQDAHATLLLPRLRGTHAANPGPILLHRRSLPEMFLRGAPQRYPCSW